MTARKPARWRACRFPEAGTRWDTPMNRCVWNRDHGRDCELVRAGKRIALVYPVKGGWAWRVGQRCSLDEQRTYLEIGSAKRGAKVAAEEDGL